MSFSGDYEGEMSRRHDLDDDTIEAILAGRTLPGREPASLAAFVEDARLVARAPVPVPSAALASVLAAGLSTEKSKRRTKRMAIVELLAGLSVATKAALGVGIAAASVGGAAVAGVAPVRDAVEAVTPFSFPDEASDDADFGRRVSTDATGEDGEKGVDGSTIADDARQRAEERRGSAPEDPASSGQRGLDQADTTPAKDHAPTSVPSGPATAAERHPAVATERPFAPPEGSPTGAPEGTSTRSAPEGTPTSAPEGTSTRSAPEGTPTSAPEGTPTSAPEGTPTSAPEGTHTWRL